MSEADVTKRIPSQWYWPKVDTSAGPDLCWPWIGKRDPNGYGNFDAHPGMRSAHRFAYFLAHGEIPEGMFVCHRCDNPPCQNPGHLFLGTQADNMADMWGKGRAVTPFRNGSGNPLAKLTEQSVREIRRLVSEGVPQKELAALHGVSRPTISLVVSRKLWAHVE